MSDVTIEIPAERVDLLYERALYSEECAAEALHDQLDRTIAVLEPIEGELPGSVKQARKELARAQSVVGQIEAARTAGGGLSLVADRDWLACLFDGALTGLADYISDESRGLTEPGPGGRVYDLLDAAEFFRCLMDELEWPLDKDVEPVGSER